MIRRERGRRFLGGVLLRYEFCNARPWLGGDAKNGSSSHRNCGWTPLHLNPSVFGSWDDTGTGNRFH